MSKKKNKNPQQSASYKESGSRRERHTVALVPDKAEPQAQRGAVPIFFIGLLFFLVLWGEMYVLGEGGDITNPPKSGGPFPETVYEPFVAFAEVDKAHPKSEADEFIAKGRQVYNLACVACHQANGLGAAGQFPPLAGSEWVLTENPARAIRLVLHGLAGPIEVKGATYNNAMPPWKDSLNDDQIAQVVSFIRNEWGNKASVVKPDQVKEWRTKDAGRGDAMNAQELLATPDK